MKTVIIIIFPIVAFLLIISFDKQKKHLNIDHNILINSLFEYGLSYSDSVNIFFTSKANSKTFLGNISIEFKNDSVIKVGNDSINYAEIYRKFYFGKYDIQLSEAFVYNYRFKSLDLIFFEFYYLNSNGTYSSNTDILVLQKNNNKYHFRTFFNSYLFDSRKSIGLSDNKVILFKMNEGCTDSTNLINNTLSYCLYKLDLTNIKSKWENNENQRIIKDIIDNNYVFYLSNVPDP